MPGARPSGLVRWARPSLGHISRSAPWRWPPGAARNASSAFCTALGLDPQCFEAHSQLALLGAEGAARRVSWPRLSPALRRVGRE